MSEAKERRIRAMGGIPFTAYGLTDGDFSGTMFGHKCTKEQYDTWLELDEAVQEAGHKHKKFKTLVNKAAWVKACENILAYETLLGWHA